MSRVCQNCGREHESRLVETFTDGDNQPIEIVVCEQARYETMTIDEFWRQHV